MAIAGNRPKKQAAVARLKAVWKFAARRAGSLPAAEIQSAIGARNGSATAAPMTRVARLPTGRRSLARSPDALSSTGFTALPTLAPSTMASVASGPIKPEAANEITARMTAMLECANQVSTAASAKLTSGSRVTAASTARTVSDRSLGAIASARRCSERSIRPSPIATRPMSWNRVPLPRPKVKTPKAISTGNTSVTSNDSTWTMSVVPTLAPSMTASAGTRSTAPASVSDVVINAVAREDCSAAVTPSPARKAWKRVRSPWPSRRRRSLPKTRVTPLWTM